MNKFAFTSEARVATCNVDLLSNTFICSEVQPEIMVFRHPLMYSEESVISVAVFIQGTRCLLVATERI